MSLPKTIDEIPEWADKMHKDINDMFEFQQLDDIKNTLKILSAVKKKLDTAINSVSTSYAVVNDKYQRRMSIFRSQLSIGNETKIDSSKSKIEFAPQIPAKGVVVVAKLSNVIDTPIYWVEELQQFAIKIAGCLIRGNIGNIYSSHDSMSKVTICRYKSRCKNLTTPEGCQYYHDPIETPGLATSYKKREVRNFTNGSFIYTHEPIKESNKNMKHIGNRSTMREDLESVSSGEAQMIADQTIHSLLTTLVLHSTNKLTPSPYLDLYES